MNVKNYLAKVAYIDDMEIGEEICKVYKSKFDNSYITHVGMEDSVKFLSDREITDELTYGVGFSPKDGKWYGWSHRAIFGFKVGSTCQKGDCHYIPLGEKSAVEDAIRFWTEDDHINVRAGNPEIRDGVMGVYVEWDYSDKIKNTSLRGQISGVFHIFPEKYGRGEWTAKTMEDAKQMAFDFNHGVS